MSKFNEVFFSNEKPETMSGWHQITTNNQSNILNTLEGTDYASLIKANPYRNLTYNVSPWQNFLKSLGIRSQADAWQENMQVQAAEYDAMIEQMKYQNEYNDPSSQAARMRQAGLNPDLQGLSNVADAANPPQDPSTPMQSTADDTQQIVGALNFITSAVSSAFGLAKNFADLRHMRILNDQGDITSQGNVVDFAKHLLETNVYNPEHWPESVGNPQYQLKQHIDNLYNQHKRGIPLKFRNSFKNALYDYAQSLNYESTKWKTSADVNDSMMKVAKQQGSEYFGDGTFESMKIVNKGVVKLSDSLVRLALERDNAKTDYEKDYYENLSGNERAAAENSEMSNKRLYNQELNPISKAKAENATNEFTAQQQTIDKLINSTLSDIVHNLARAANRGDLFAQSMLFSFAIARMSSVSFGPKGVSLGFNPK